MAATTIHAKVSARTKQLVDEYAQKRGISRSASAAHIIERGLRTLDTVGFGGNCCGGKLYGFCSASAVCAEYPIKE